MDIPEAEAVMNVDNVFLYSMYGFLVLLGIFILFSFGRMIYHFYKIRREHNIEPIDDTIHTVCHSISDETSDSARPSETNVPDSERLRLQLDKLRRLLNRLNAMGTFSRDTIGDLSAESAVRVNISKAASSDMSEFWSSIDVDEFDDSTINDDKFGKTPTEKSVSPSISDYSLDTSGIPFDNVRHKNFATSSRENFLNVPSAFNRPTNPSDAIVQILTILESIMLKNKDCDRLLKNTLKIEKTSEESLKTKDLIEGVHAPETSRSSQKQSSLSLSVATNKKCSTIESLNSDTVIPIPEDKSLETLSSDINIVRSVISSKPLLFEQLSHTIDSHCKLSSEVSVEAKISKVKSVVNVRSSSESQSFYSRKVSSSKSLNKISISRSVSLLVDSFACLSTHLKEISKSVSAPPEDQNYKDMQFKTPVAEIAPFALDIEAINRSHSLSDLLEKTLLSIESSIQNTHWHEKESEIPTLQSTTKSQNVKTLFPSSYCSQKHPTQSKETLGHGTAKSNSSTQETNNKMFISASSRSLHSPVFSNSLALKSSVSEPEIKQSQTLGMLSPELSSGSDTFLSPLIIDVSPSENIYWKSPMQLNSDTVANTLTPNNGNQFLKRKSCIWSTPPLPLQKEIVTDEILI